MLIVLLFFILCTQAAPTIQGSQQSPIPSSAGSNLIVRSCLLTIAACVYRAIHQNVPDPNASWWKRQTIRIKIAFYALIAPEAMIWWAMRQWFGAKEVMKRVNTIKPELKWTLTHGHFAQMGGFGRLDTEQILYHPTLLSLLQNDQIDMNQLQRISQKRIQDRSKGDILSKGIIALQTTWFVFECLARLHQKLPIVELEVVTLAFATLNTLTYAFWWYKPLDVLCPIYLHTRPAPDIASSSIPPIPQDDEGRAIAGGSEEQREDLQTGRLRRGGVLAAWLKKVSHALQTCWKEISTAAITHIKVMKVDVQNDGWWTTTWKRLIANPLTSIAAPLWELFTDDKVHENSSHVSPFYAMEIPHTNWAMVLFSCCSVGMVFGGIHFLSWNTPFPTRLQLHLWRMSSITMVAEPFCLALQGIVGLIDDNSSPGTWHESVAEGLASFFGVFVVFLGPIVYVLSRFFVLVLAFITLRDLKDDAFETIAWAAYIPHL